MQLIEHTWHGPVLALCFATDAGLHRETRVPGADVTDLTEEVQDEAEARWTPQVISAYEAERNAPLVVLTPEEQAAAARLAEFPDLEPDEFWFGVRVAGYEADIRAWVAGLNNPESPDYDPVSWAAASSKLDASKHFERDHPWVEAARVAIGMSEVELDYLWRYARQKP